MNHPVVGWPYSIGLQRDVSSKVSVEKLLRAGDDETLLALSAAHRANVDKHVQCLDMQADSTVEYFHSKSMEMWEEMMRMISVSVGELKVQSLSEAPSTALSSGASTVQEFVNSTTGSDIGAHTNLKVSAFAGFSLSRLIASAACGSA